MKNEWLVWACWGVIYFYITILGRLGQITGVCETGLEIETERKF